MAKVHSTGDGRWVIFCDGCGCGHAFDGRWTFNGDMEKPTFRQSHRQTGPNGMCHIMVTDGIIHYEADSAHTLRGQDVPLKDF